MNLARLGEENVRRFPEYVALHFEGREWTNVDQQRAACRLANALRRLGIGPGDRFVVMLPNCPEVLHAYGAVLKPGAVFVPVIFLLSPEEVRHILADSGARLAFASPELLSKLEGFAGTTVLVGGGAPGTLGYDELVARAADTLAAGGGGARGGGVGLRPRGPGRTRGPAPPPRQPPRRAPARRGASTSSTARRGRSACCRSRTRT